ncbi:MAG: hypothetical protein ACRDHY_03020 [Anaerolineales bacterium]
MVIRGFKGAVTAASRKRGFRGVIWQKGHYERVVRDDEELEQLIAYIDDNPMRWAEDKENMPQ